MYSEGIFGWEGGERGSEEVGLFALMQSFFFFFVTRQLCLCEPE